MNGRGIRRWLAAGMLIAAAIAGQAGGQQSPAPLKGARIFIGPMADNFDILLMTALGEKKVPMVTVNSAARADYVLEAVPTEANETSRSKLMPLHSSTETVQMVELRLTDTVIGGVKWSYAVNLAPKEGASAKDTAKQRADAAAEVAQHLKDFIDKQKK